MADRCVYIGRLDDPRYLAERDTPQGCVPTALSPDFPPVWKHWDSPFNFMRSEFDGEQADWAGWVYPMSKVEIRNVVRRLYEGNENYSDGTPFPHWRPWLAELETFVDGIEDDGQWAIVATEFD